MKKRGIGFRIVIMAVVLSAIATAIGIIGLYATKSVSALVTTMYRKDVLRILYVGNIQTDFESARCILLDANTVGRTKKQTENSLNEFRKSEAVFEKDIENLESTNLQAEDKRDALKTIKTSGSEYFEKGEAMFDYISKNDLSGASDYLTSVVIPIRVQKLGPAIEKLVNIQIRDSKTSFEESGHMATLSLFIIICAIVVGLAASFILGLTITRSITKPVSKIVNNLSDSASQINISSAQLSSASQEIANGAQEQASSIEETTSSMEELSSMVKQNLGNTRQASLLSEKATEASQNGFDKMTDMLSAMNGISKSTEDIRNVIDVIDDIAFQTNMLALNAAVEAARAGEAGMGFAVVADEVKNLANRSSDSAKETASMIKETLKNVEDGMMISKELSEIFKEILTNSKKVMEMNREVETASGQQDEGIGEVNKAIVQFDAVVQTNAASAEETASAAEELQGQVSSLNEIVDTLYLIVSGKAYTGKAASEIHTHQLGKDHPSASPPQNRHAAAPAHEPAKAGSGEKTGMQETAVKKAAGSAAEKDRAQKTGSADASDHKNNGHTISFEDDEEFKQSGPSSQISH